MGFAGLSGRIAALGRKDPQRQLFGALMHRYRLDFPVSVSALGRLEQDLGCQLPADYREFLLLADGGAGPYYGIFSLQASLDRVREATGSLDVLAKESPLTATIDFGVLCGKPAEWNAHVARLAEDPQYAAAWDQQQAVYSSPPWNHGLLPIADYGCGDVFCLVLRGPRRGSVWVDSLDSCSGLFDLGVDFATFYGRWLEDAERRVSEGDFEPSPRGFLEYAAG